MPRVKQFDEAEILNKAMELFWEKGFHATSMQDLVSHLGINRASLYDTFGSKEALFQNAVEHYIEVSGSCIRTLFAVENDVRVGLKKLFDMAINESLCDLSKKGCFVVNTTTELIPGDAAIQEMLQKNRENMEAVFVDYIQKGIDKGQIDAFKNAQDVGLMFFGLYNGLRVLAKVDPTSESLKKMATAGLSILN
ncbi:TetR/AcrR family transcriptional regulator [Flagellimonas olearia]|nr:TetR/AcrR family transcriptional regulator [Allomuricauda olearia]